MSEYYVQTKYRGALLGVAIGDALGAPFEGAYSVSAREINRLLDSDGVARFTDDTHMTISLAKSLIERQGFDGAHLARTFADNFFAEPWRGYGSGPPRIFRAIADGADWRDPARQLFGGTGSYGNGAAMRVAPVALFAAPSTDDVRQLAHQAASITHAHELGLAGAALQATAILILLQRLPNDPLKLEEFIDELLEHVDNVQYQRKLRAIRILGRGAEPDQVVTQLGNGIAALDSVPTAIYAFLRSPDSFEGVIRFALSLGGDVDTIASMAGALSGAYLGEEAIPDRWIERVEGTATMRSLADRLHDLQAR